MKANQVIERYNAGERNFRRLNLSGQSFKNQNLSGADFSYSSLYGTDFSNANLSDCKLIGIKAGIQISRKIILILATFVLTTISILFTWICTTEISFGFWISREMFKRFWGNNLSEEVFNIVFEQSKLGLIIRGVLALIVLAIYLITTIFKNLNLALEAYISASLFITMIGSMIGGLFAVRFGVLNFNLGNFFINIGLGIFLGGLPGFIGGFLLAGAGVMGSLIIGLAIFLADSEIKTSRYWVTIIISTVSLIGITLFSWSIKAKLGGIIAIISINFLVVFVGCIIGWQSLAGNSKYEFIKNVGIFLGAIGGTSFKNANLTNCDFTQALLKSTNFNQSIIKHTRFYDATKLDYSRVEKTILVDSSVQDLLIKGNGRNKSYIGINLRGAYLAGSDLKNADFRGSDISEVTFQRACLEWTNLTLTQAIGTDFRNAQMTGACIEAWNTESSTNLEDVDCRFVYLLESPKRDDDRERRPSFGEFAPGEFTKLFQKILHTVDLVFGDGIDWEAFIRAFKNVKIENEDTELAIQSVENKGDGVFVIRVSVPVNTDKEKIHSDFNRNYDIALKAVEEKYKIMLNNMEETYQIKLESKEELIKNFRQQNIDMWMTINRLAERQPITVEVTATGEANQTYQNMKNKTSSFDLRNAQLAGGLVDAETVNAHQIGGKITNYTQKQEQNIAQAAAQIQQLIQQLEQTNPTTTTSERMTVVAKAVDEIEKSPNLKALVIGALKSGSKEALKEAVDHPLVNILMASIEGWQDAE